MSDSKRVLPERNKRMIIICVCVVAVIAFVGILSEIGNNDGSDIREESIEEVRVVVDVAEARILSVLYELGYDDVETQSKLIYSEGIQRIVAVEFIVQDEPPDIRLVRVMKGGNIATSHGYIYPVNGETTLKEVLENKDANIKHAKLTWAIS